MNVFYKWEISKFEVGPEVCQHHNPPNLKYYCIGKDSLTEVIKLKILRQEDYLCSPSMSP